MAEYIEREALIRRIKEIHCDECNSYHGVRCRACWVDDTVDYIESEPYTGLDGGYYPTSEELVAANLEWLRQPAEGE